MFRNPRQVVFTFVSVGRLTAVFNFAGVGRFAEASNATSVEIVLVAGHFRFCRIFAAS